MLNALACADRARDHMRGGLGFAVRAAVLSVALFAALRLSWVEQTILWPFTLLQGRLAASLGGGPMTIGRMGLSCSGSDAIALCVGAILAWPAPWRARLAGAIVGAAVIFGLNIVRIVTLVRVSDSTGWFEALHLYIWPACFTLAIAGYFLGWMSLVERRTRPATETRQASYAARWPPLTHFALATIVCTMIFIGTAPLYLESPPVRALASWMATAAASLLGLLGGAATASGSVLRTARGAFLVTGECIATPVIPVSIAAALAWPRTWKGRTTALVAVGPLCVALGIARLLVLALPTAVTGAPEFWAHAFFQLVVGGVTVAVVAAWRDGAVARGPARTVARVALALGSGIAVAALLGDRYVRVVQEAAHRASDLMNVGGAMRGDLWPTVVAPDAQGALQILPPYQAGLFVALCLAAFASRHRWRRWAGCLTILVGSHVLLLVIVDHVVAGARTSAAVPWVRAWAVAWPVILVLVADRCSGSARPDIRHALRMRCARTAQVTSNPFGLRTTK